LGGHDRVERLGDLSGGVLRFAPFLTCNLMCLHLQFKDEWLRDLSVGALRFALFPTCEFAEVN